MNAVRRNAFVQQIQFGFLRTDKIQIRIRHNPFILCANVCDVGVQRSGCVILPLIHRRKLRTQRKRGHNNFCIFQQFFHFVRNPRLHWQGAASACYFVQLIIKTRTVMHHLRKSAVQQGAAVWKQRIHQIKHLNLCMGVHGSKLLPNGLRHAAMSHAEIAG